MPVHKPRQRSALVQFTVDLRVVARVTRRGQHRTTTAVRELTLPMPVVVRIPEPDARRMLADATDGSDVQSPAAHSVPGVPQP